MGKSLVLGLMFLAGVVTASAQVYWDIDSVAIHADGQVWADNEGFLDQITCNAHWGILTTDDYDANAYVSNVFGRDRALWRKEEASEDVDFDVCWGGRHSKAKSTIQAWSFVDGLGTSQVEITWLSAAVARALSERYLTGGITHLTLYVRLRIYGGPAGYPCIIYTSWDHFGGVSTSHEAGTDDPAMSTATLTFSGRPEQFQGRFDFSNLGPGLSGFNQLKNQTDSLNRGIGDVVEIRVNLNDPAVNPLNGLAQVGIPFASPRDDDKADAIQRGRIRLSVGAEPTPPPPPPPTPPDTLHSGWFEFSLDIGSDAELSDPNLNGNEAFDPGDSYRAFGPLMPPGGLDGIGDDFAIFGPMGFADPAPSAPDLWPPATGAPVGSGLPLDPMLFFDLNGEDYLDFSIANYVYGPGMPSIDISTISTNCVHSAAHLFISFDDDGGSNYTHPAGAPISDVSPFMGFTYGETATKTEIVGMDFVPFPPTAPYFQYGMFDEVSLHPNLIPNPDLLEQHDDDVDALDIRDANCTVWYISADHEASHGLDPGIIYEVNPVTGPTAVLYAFDLGILPGTDIDAFEFVALWDSVEQHVALALLFSVDDDDPLTPGDESGGLHPAMIYYSFLNGSYAPYLASPLQDDVDAIAAWPVRLYSDYTSPPPCNPPVDVTIQAGSGGIVTVCFTAPEGGAYIVYACDTPNGVWPADYAAQMTVLLNAGDQFCYDDVATTDFRKYVVVKQCL